MATFTADEKKQMWKLFKLEPTQFWESNSTYNLLIARFEELDTANGDLLVPDIQADLASITADQATLATLKSSGPISQFQADGEGEVTFVSGSSQFSTLAGDIRGRIKCIKDQIDPHGLLDQFVMSARAIPTT